MQKPMYRKQQCDNLICYMSKGWAVKEEGSRFQTDDGSWVWWVLPVWHSAGCRGAVAQVEGMVRFTGKMGGS